jgi:hypothetical protein
MTRGETMKFSRLTGVPVLLVLAAAMALGQDAAHDVDKGATKTGKAIKHAGKTVGHVTKSGAKDTGHGTKVVAKGAKKATQKTGEGIKDATRDATGKPAPSKPN